MSSQAARITLIAAPVPMTLFLALYPTLLMDPYALAVATMNFIPLYLATAIAYLPAAAAVAASLLALSWRRTGAAISLVALECIVLASFSAVGALPALAMAYPLTASLILSLLYPVRRRLAYPEGAAYSKGGAVRSTLSLTLQYVAPTLYGVGAALLFGRLLTALSMPPELITGPLASIITVISGTMLYKTLIVLMLLALGLWATHVFVNLVLDTALLLAYRSRELASSVLAEEIRSISKGMWSVGFGGAMIVGGFLLYPLIYGLSFQLFPGLSDMGFVPGWVISIVFFFVITSILRLILARVFKGIGSTSRSVSVKGHIALALFVATILAVVALSVSLSPEQLIGEALLHRPQGETPRILLLDDLEGFYLQSMRRLAEGGDAAARALIFFLWGY